MDSYDSKLDDLLDRMISYILDKEGEIDNVEFWVDFKLMDDEEFTPAELKEIYTEIILRNTEENGIEFLREINQAIVFLNWNNCKYYKKSLEFDHINHVLFSWIVSTEEEIENNVLLSLSEISNRFSDLRDQYDVTGTIPDCLQPEYIEMILSKVKKANEMKEKLVSEFDKVISESEI